MIELLFKASLAIAIALLFYKLVLQQESFFATNRLYLLGCIVLAFTLPFISIPKLINQQGYLSSVFQKEIISVVEKEQEVSIYPDYSLSSEPVQSFSEESAGIPTENVQEELTVKEEVLNGSSFTTDQSKVQTIKTGLPVVPAENRGYSFSFWIAMFYLFGVAVFSLSLIYQVGVVFYKILTATDKVRDGDCVIVTTLGKQAPCSFFNYIFIHPDDYDFKTYEQIIAHEKTHVKLGHSLDMLFAELAIIVLWFNPLIWLFRKEIEKNNEYQTDAMLLEKEQVRKETYQLNLLQIAVPNKPLNITTNYNQSLIKQRIIMMNSKKSTTNAYWKYSFLLPLFFGMLLLINEPAASQEPTPESSPIKENVNEKQVISEQKTVEIQEIVSENTVIREVVNSDGSIVQEEISADSARKTLPVREPLRSAREPLESRTPASGLRENIAQHRRISTNTQGRQTDMTKGFWYSARENGEYCIQFKGNKGPSSWNMSRCFETGAFQRKGSETFVLTKESGTLELTGNLEAEVGQGKYVFTANPEFRQYLASNNISSDSENLIFHLFFGNVGRNYIDFLKQQYGEVEGNRLLELAIHGVSQDSFKNYIALFQKYSNKKPSIREVVEARIHGIDQAYVEEIQKMGFTDLTLRKMMEAKIHGVSASYVEDLEKAGFRNLSMDKIISAKIHGVDPATIKEIQTLGKGELSIDKIIELKIHNVSSDYIKQLESAGLANLSLDQVVSAKIHGLSPTSIKEIKSLGYKDLAFNDLLTARIHKVDAGYVKAMRDAGFPDLTINEIVSAKIHRLDPEAIKEIRTMGFNDISFNELLSAQIHRVDANYVKDLQKAGFDNLAMDKIVSAKIHGIDSNFIEESRKKGYDLNSLHKYISLKIHGRAMESLKNP